MVKNDLELMPYIYALNALKKQASAVCANNYKVDKNKLKRAQQEMSALHPYTLAVSKLLMKNKEKV